MLTDIQALLKSILRLHLEPFSIVHFITNRCNARCKHCFIDFENPTPPPNELTLEEISRLTRTFGTILYNVNITGGEPFLRQDLFEIVRCYLENTQVRSIVITTNGWFTDEIRRLVWQYAKLDTDCTLTISISIDHIGDKHDAGRNLAGLYARALASYRAVVASSDHRIVADIALTVTDSNAAGITDIFNALTAERVVRISPVLLRTEGVMRITTDRAAMAAAYRKLTTLTKTMEAARTPGVAQALHRAKNSISHKILAEQCSQPRYITACRGGALLASIGDDGTVYPCELLTDEFPLGNLRDYDMDFMKIWRDSPAQAARDSIRTGKCHCTFECAWTVNIVTSPTYWPNLFFKTLRELL